MIAEPTGFKEISVKRILIALIFFVLITGILVLSAKSLPNETELLGDIAISFILSVTFVVSIRNRVAEHSKDGNADEIISRTKKRLRFVQRIIVYWLLFFVWFYLLKQMV